MCCRCQFDDIPTTLKHIFSCPRISDGWYWCPFCFRPENVYEVPRYGKARWPRREWLTPSLKPRVPILRHLIHYLMPWVTMSIALPTEVHASPNARNRCTIGLGSAPELESVAYMAEMPANDPRWYYPEAGGVDRQELEASSNRLLGSRAAEPSISTATHSVIQTMSQASTNIKSKQRQISELQESSPIGCREVLRRLATNRELLEMCSKASPNLLFEKGICTLKVLIARKMCSNFEDVFAITQVLLAVTYILHHDDESCDWKGFIWSLSYWQRIIEDKLDPQLFADARDQLDVLRDCTSAPSSRASSSSKFTGHCSI